jgi:hypothetical protein
MNNDKLNELAIKAGLISEEDGKFTRTYLNYEEKKFAELIVEECMSYMEDGDIDFAKFMIKKHFGVEQ